MITETRLWKPSNGKTYLFTKENDKNGTYKANLRQIMADGSVSEPLQTKSLIKSKVDPNYIYSQVDKVIIREGDGYYSKIPFPSNKKFTDFEARSYVKKGNGISKINLSGSNFGRSWLNLRTIDLGDASTLERNLEKHHNSVKRILSSVCEHLLKIR